jgi:hypothetical protein
MIAEAKLMLAAFTHLFPKFHKYVASTVKQNVNDGRTLNAVVVTSFRVVLQYKHLLGQTPPPPQKKRGRRRYAVKINGLSTQISTAEHARSEA